MSREKRFLDDDDSDVVYDSGVVYKQPVPKARTRLSAVLQKYPQVMDNVNLINIHLDKFPCMLCSVEIK